MDLPKSLADNPTLQQWIEFDRNGMVILFVGKVEIGQGITTGLLQIAADELDLSPEKIRVQAGDTATTPDEGWTSASISIEVCGQTVKLVCAEVAYLLKQAFSRVARVDKAEISVRNGHFLINGRDTQSTYWDIAQDIDLHQPFQDLGHPKRSKDLRLVGTSWPRIDLFTKLQGAGFIHDLELPNMLHARVIRASHPQARLEFVDAEGLNKLPGITEVIIDGSFVAICGDSEAQVAGALKESSRYLKWVSPTLPAPNELFAQLRRKAVLAESVESNNTTKPQSNSPPPGQSRLRQFRTQFR